MRRLSCLAVALICGCAVNAAGERAAPVQAPAPSVGEQAEERTAIMPGPRPAPTSDDAPTVDFCGQAITVTQRDIACTNKEQRSLEPLANLKAPRTIVITFAPITDLAPLANHDSLETLVVLFSQVSDLADTITALIKALPKLQVTRPSRS